MTATAATATVVVENDCSNHTVTGIEKNGDIQQAAITRLKIIKGAMIITLKCET